MHIRLKIKSKVTHKSYLTNYGKCGLLWDNAGTTDRDRNYAFQQASYGPIEELQGFLTYDEHGTLFTRGFVF